MRKHHLLSLSLLIPALLTLSGVAALQAQQKAPAAKRWSDASTWPDKKVPAADALVTIDKDMNVVLDVSPMPLHGLTINGKLSFYAEALDRDVKKPHERPSIGVLLCASKDDEVVEFALARTTSPTLVAEYQTMLPPKEVLRAKLHEFYAQLAPAHDEEGPPEATQPKTKDGKRRRRG